MSEINKFGEIDGSTCPACDSPVKATWVACPECGKKLKGSKGKSDSNESQFICPGCGEKATAEEDAAFCKTCKAFVHSKCAVKGERMPSKEKEWFYTFKYLCPVCDNILKVASACWNDKSPDEQML